MNGKNQIFRDEVSRRLGVVDHQIQRLLYLRNQDGRVEDRNQIYTELTAELSSLRLFVQEPKDDDRRRDLRMDVEIITRARIAGQTVECVVENISVNGASLIPRLDLEAGDSFEIDIPMVGALKCEVIALSDEGTHVKFVNPDNDQQVALADMIKDDFLR